MRLSSLCRTLVAVASSLMMASVWAEPGVVTLLHINDVYQIAGTGKNNETGGMARLRTLIQQEQQQDPELLVVHAGDLLSPSFLSSWYKGEQMIRLLNDVGVQVITPGNHEFDFGLPVLKERMAQSQATWLAANLRDNGKPFEKALDAAIWTVQGVKVGMFGLITPSTGLLARNLERVTFLPVIETARGAVAQLQAQGAEVIIAVTHLDFKEDEALAREVPGIALILGGHDHEIRQSRVNQTLIVKSGADLSVVGRIVLRKRNNHWLVETAYLPLDASVAEDPRIQEIVKGYIQTMDQALNKPVGRTTVDLDGLTQSSRTRETNLGNLITDIMRQAVQADVAIFNGGGIRSDQVMPAGELTAKDVRTLFPFDNLLFKLEVTGQTLREALENGLSQVEQVKGRFPQVAGMNITYDPAKPAGQRLVAVTIAGKPLDPKKVYTLAVNDYLAEGGDGYAMFKPAKRLIDPAYAGLVTDAVIQAIQQQKEVSPKVEGRVVSKK